MYIKSFCFNGFGTNCYLLWDAGGAGVAVDPGMLDAPEWEAFEDTLAKEGVSLGEIWLTHGHFDHIYGAARLAGKYGAVIRMSPEDRPVLEGGNSFASAFGLPAPDAGFRFESLADGQELGFGSCTFKVITTPGHTPGSVCFYDGADKVLLSGDTLFAGSIGRTDLPYGDYDKLIVSVMDKIMGLPGDTDVLPGHGGRTDIGYERTHNPFLQPFNEPEEDLEAPEDTD